MSDDTQHKKLKATIYLFFYLFLICFTACAFSQYLKDGVHFSYPIWVFKDQYVVDETRLSGEFCLYPKVCNLVFNQVEYEVKSGNWTDAGLVKLLGHYEEIVPYKEEDDGCIHNDMLKNIPCSPNYVMNTTVVPNDPMFSKLWGLKNIRAQKAWKKSTGIGSSVAVIDSGIDINHPDLKNKIIGCYDATTDTEGSCTDENGHGTHVSGTIAADTDNGIGVSGVCPDCRIMALKFIGAKGSGSLFAAIKAIDYATTHGAKIINASWGGGAYSQPLYDAISRFSNAGGAFIAAAGNEGLNNDKYIHYPSGYDLPNILTVGAIGESDKLAYFSNFGLKSVALAAPGMGIVSTCRGGGYCALSGTSMSTPHVAGVAALIRTRTPEITPAKLINRLKRNIRKVTPLGSKIGAGGVLNANKALR